jgi:plastocyanin
VGLACSDATAPLAEEPLAEAGTIPEDDSGTTPPFDSGGARDTGARDTGGGGGDAGSDAPAGDGGGDASGADAGDGGIVFTLNGCPNNPNNYQDETGGNDNREIAFNNNQYNNRCMRVRVNQSVTWRMQGGNTFANHPLVQKGGSPGNPIPSTPVNVGTAYSVTFTQQGLFGFGCATHTTIQNESGAVYVVP